MKAEEIDISKFKARSEITEEQAERARFLASEMERIILEDFGKSIEESRGVEVRAMRAELESMGFHVVITHGFNFATMSPSVVVDLFLLREKDKGSFS